MKKRLNALFCTWFGSGRSPVIPGTAGSLAALPFAYVLHATLGAGAVLVFSLVIFNLGVWACRVYLDETGKSDPGEIVIDEVAGQCLVLAFLAPAWQDYLVGFLLFRLFDIVKPWPVSWADRKIKGAFGVMLDDIIAALCAIVLLFIASALIAAG